MKRRIIAAVLAFCILLVCAPVPTTAAGDSIGKYAVPNPDVTSFFVYNEDTGDTDSFYFSDFSEDTVFYVEDYKTNNKGEWYKVSFHTGTVVSDYAQFWPAKPWVIADGLKFIDLCTCCEHCTGAEGCECGCESCDFCEKEEEIPCPICGTPGCTSDHPNWCEICKKDDCGIDHTATEPSEPENTCACCDSCTGAEGCECGCESCDFCEKEEEIPCPICGTPGCTSDHPNWCEICKKDDCGEKHISATVNGQTVTVTGDTLPESAELIAVEAVANLDGGFAYDIKILDTNGNEWQPSDGQKVTLSIPVPGVANGEYIELIHLLENESAIQKAISEGNVWTEDWVTDVFPAAAAAYQTLTGEKNTFAFEVFKLKPKDGMVTAPVESFSIYFWTGSSFTSTVAGVSDDIIFHDTLTSVRSTETFFVTPGQAIRCNRGGVAAVNRQWRYSGISLSANKELEGANGAEILFTVPSGAKAGTSFYIECRIWQGFGWTSWWRVNFVVVEERTVTFNGNGGTAGASSLTAITDGGSRNQNITLPNATRTGYNFLGWYTAASGGDWKGGNGTSYMPGSNGVTLYAQWSYDVNYNLNGGSGTSNKQTINANNTVNLHGTPTRSGYTFLGWYSSADGVIYTAGATYSAKKLTTMTALWGKQSSTSGWNKNFYILPGTTSATFADALKYIDVDATNNSIKGDCNTYYIAPGTSVALAHDSGMWSIDGAKSGLSLKAGSATAGAGSWTAASTNATLTVSASAAEGTTMMIYVRDAAEPAEVSCARIIVDKVSDITANATNDTQGIYRVGLFVICDSTKIPGEPNYTTGVDMTNYQNIGMAYKSKGSDVIDPSIGSSAHYISSIDGSCTMGVVDYTGYETVNFVTQTLLDDAMQTVIDAITSGSKTMIAADGTNLNQYYTEHGGANGGAEAIRANFSVRPHIAKLMTGLGFSDLGWHVDCSIYPLQTISLTYNLNLPTGYILKTVGTPAPGIFTGDLDVEEAVFTVPAKPQLNSVYSATVTGATDTVSLTFKGWNTEADGTGETYVPGSPITIESDTILYAKWSGGEFNTGTLEIYKEVSTVENSDEPSNGDTFAFEINLGGSYAYTVYAASTGAKLRSGTMTNGTFTLQDGQFIRFTGVPKAKYTITETSLPVHYSIETATQEINLVGGYVNKVTFSNEYSNIPSFTITGTIDNGTVNGTVQKESQSVLRGSSSAEMVFMPNEGYEISSITVDDSSITVTEALKKGYTYPVQNNVTAAHTVVVTTIKKTYTVNVVADSGVDVGETYPRTVEHGENITITFAPKSGYEIQRVDVDGQSYGTAIEQGILKLEIKKDTTVTITSVCTLGDLTIQKTGDNIDPNQVFIFEVTCGDDFKLQVPVKGKGSVTIYQLKDGTYTVTEITTWSWRYTPNQQSQTVTISAGDITTVTFNNSRTNNDWLSAFYNIINAKGS